MRNGFPPRILVFVFGLCLLIQGQADKPAPVYVKPGTMKASTARPGESLSLKVPFVVTPGFHIQSNPASQRQLIATILDLPAKEGIQVGAPVYPKGKPYRLKGAQTDISVYDGTFHLELPLLISDEAKPGKYTLPGTLKFQACNDTVCFFPTKIPVELSVVVLPRK